MLKIERQNIIDQEINKQGFVLVPAMREMLKCSEETIRRDLKEMESQGRLMRTHGGAYLIENFDKTYPTNLRKAYYHQTKDCLARRAIEHMQENDIVMLDSSTTCLALAEAMIRSQKMLTVITNSLQICLLCNESNINNINLICPGGAFRRRTSSFADQHTIDMLRTYHADRAFISCPKLTVEYGLSDNHLSEARVRETMLKQSQERYLIVDHTKFNSSANILFEGLELVDMIITDQKLDEDWEKYIASRGIKVEYCTE